LTLPFLTRFLEFLEGLCMDPNHEDRFTLYVRTDPCHALSPEEIEVPLGSFSTYEDALRAQRAAAGVRDEQRVSGGVTEHVRRRSPALERTSVRSTQRASARRVTR
jgi:hypothetical protein